MNNLSISWRSIGIVNWTVDNEWYDYHSLSSGRHRGAAGEEDPRRRHEPPGVREDNDDNDDNTNNNDNDNAIMVVIIITCKLMMMLLMLRVTGDSDNDNDSEGLRPGRRLRGRPDRGRGRLRGPLPME